MSNRKYQTENRSVAGLTGGGEFRALTDVPGRHRAQVLLPALTGLFMQNTAPTLWEIGQFQELMLNLLPVVDRSTRQDLMAMLSHHPHTPDKVLTALASEFHVQNSPETKPAAGHAVSAPRQHPRYTVKQLRDILPLQVSGKMAKVAALAARRNDRNTLRTVLATHLSVSRPFADHLLTNPDGFALATALRALRMPKQVARTILLASHAMHSSQLTGLPQQIESFDRLDPEACRKRLLDWEQTFLNGRKPQPQIRSRSGHQPHYIQAGEDGSRPSDITRRAAGPASPGRKSGRM